jgi:hypothetical protein
VGKVANARTLLVRSAREQGDKDHQFNNFPES